ncbi:MAG: DUF1990 domain-containing protein [Blastocatellia bacterium]
MFSLRRPTAETIAALIERQAACNFTYPGAGATRDDCAPPGFDRDHNRVRLGSGEAAFAAACAALRRWRMFPPGWTEIYPPDAPLAAGTVVGMMARCYGGWWLNACRIVYVINEDGPVRRFGFAYGTLPEHVECGEERFLIEWQRADDAVWYDLRAFSQPRHPLVRLAYPLARRLQRRFARESLAAMVAATAKGK